MFKTHVTRFLSVVAWLFKQCWQISPVATVFVVASGFISYALQIGSLLAIMLFAKLVGQDFTTDIMGYTWRATSNSGVSSAVVILLVLLLGGGFMSYISKRWINSLNMQFAKECMRIEGIGVGDGTVAGKALNTLLFATANITKFVLFGCVAMFLSPQITVFFLLVAAIGFGVQYKLTWGALIQDETLIRLRREAEKSDQANSSNTPSTGEINDYLVEQENSLNANVTGELIGHLIFSIGVVVALVVMVEKYLSGEKALFDIILYVIVTRVFLMSLKSIFISIIGFARVAKRARKVQVHFES